MLKITIHDSASQFRFHLEGRLSGPWVQELRQCWLTASSTTAGRNTVLDLRDVDFIDPEGQRLVAEMDARSVRIAAATPFIQAIVDEACGRPGCGTVEEKLARSTDAILSPHTLRHRSAV